jgi:hypothetical protein
MQAGLHGAMIGGEKSFDVFAFCVGQDESVITNCILSYDNCQEIIELYHWASLNLIDATYCIKGTKLNWQKTKEILIVPNLE